MRNSTGAAAVTLDDDEAAALEAGATAGDAAASDLTIQKF